MTIYTPVSSCAKNVVHLSGHVQHVGNTIFNVLSGGQFASCRFSLRPGHSGRSYARLSISKVSSSPSVINLNASRSSCLGSGFSKQRGNFKSSTFKGLVGDRGRMKRHINVSMNCENLRMRLSASKRGLFSKIKGNVGSVSWSQGCTSTGLIFGLMVCNSSSEPTHAEASMEKEDEKDDCDMPYVKFSRGKKIYTDYSIKGIPGDGRCLFRSVAHGACIRVGKPAPSESLQRELADDLRARVADEFIKRRQETEWFVEGDFDTYVEQIRKPRVWGGEPELLMASHVLKMPITVYMHDEDAGGLISIAEYGQEYGRRNPIRVLYHGFGHYDALQIPARRGGKAKL